VLLGFVPQSAVWISAQEYVVQPRFEITGARVTRDKENTIRAVVEERGLQRSLQNLIDKKRATADTARFDARNATIQSGQLERKYELRQELSNEGVKIIGTITRQLGAKPLKEYKIETLLPPAKVFTLVLTDVDGKRRLVVISLVGG
jgi:lipopolysaccharide export system protein LptA